MQQQQFVEVIFSVIPTLVVEFVEHVLREVEEIAEDLLVSSLKHAESRAAAQDIARRPLVLFVQHVYFVISALVLHYSAALSE